MAKLSELIKCLEDGGQIRRVVRNTSYLWFTIGDLDDRCMSTLIQHYKEYEMREAPPKPKEVTFKAWMVEDDIDEDKCRSYEFVDFSNKQGWGRAYTEVEISIKEIV